MSLEDNIVALAEAMGSDVKDLREGKVDRVVGKGLSDRNFTQAEKDKLSSLEGSKFVGLFVSEDVLPLSGSEGDYANVDSGVGSDTYRVIWDSSDSKWVKMQGVSTDLTPAQIKQQYESNPDTNAFTNDEKVKLASVAEAIGDLSQLPTLNKDNVVDSLREVVQGNVDMVGQFLELITPIDDAAGLGDTDVTWSADKSSRELDDKVDKVAGKQLSDTNFTQVEKTKLASVGDLTRNFVDDYVLARG